MKLTKDRRSAKRLVQARVGNRRNVTRLSSPEAIFEHYREPVTPEAARAWYGVVPKA
jgi:hypothetical protein